MNVGVAADARRQLRRSCIHRVNRAGRYRAMALIAQPVDVRHIQEPGILRSVRSVASQASLCLDRGMLVNKRPARLRVALCANRILVGRGLQVLAIERAMRIVAVGTLNQALVKLVVKGHIEGRFDIGMTLEAKGRLAGLEHGSLRSSLMHGVAADATHVGLSVRRAEEVRMSACVAAEASGIYGLGIRSRKIQDLCLVAARLYVSLPRPVAALTGDALTAMLQRQFGMRI